MNKNYICPEVEITLIAVEQGIATTGDPSGSTDPWEDGN